MGSAAEPEGDGALERGGGGGKDAERRGGMEVSDAAGSRESAGRETSCGREDTESL